MDSTPAETAEDFGARARPSERPRRTQSERRSATTQRLLTATIESLIELGYAATTTLEVERRAGVSRGARIHHFPTKAQLLAAAVDELFDRLNAHYDVAFGNADPSASDAARLRTGLRHLWSIYSGAEYFAALELNMAARTDAELRAQLIDVTQRHRALAQQAALKHFPVVAPDVAYGLVEAVQTTLLGLLMQRNVQSDAQRENIVLSLLESLIVTYLPSESSPSQAERSREAVSTKRSAP